MMLARSSSLVWTLSRSSPSVSDQESNFSTSHAATPTGLSIIA